MKVRIPVVYDATVVPKKARNPRSETFGEWIEAEIREVTDFEAPVALRWASDSILSPGIGGTCERRWHAGRLWQPLAYRYSGRPDEHVTMERMLDWTGSGSTSSPLVTGHDWKVSRFIGLGHDNPLDPDRFRMVSGSGRSEAMAEALQAADDILVVDGLVWQAALEPVYRVSMSSGFYDSYLRLEIVSASEDGERHEGVFRADRFDDMAAYAMDKWKREPDGTSRIHVLIPECLRYDDEVPALLSSLRHAVSSEESGIGKKDKASIVAWVEMRDAVDALERGTDEDAIAAAVTAAEVWLQVADAYAFTKENVASALARWNARPISFAGDDHANSLGHS